MMRTMNYFRCVMNDELLLDEVFVNAILCLSTTLCLLPNRGMMSNYFANYVSVVPVVISSLYAR
jgi:hypothetical protein